MKVLQILVLILGFSIFVNAQAKYSAALSGTVADANGAVIPKIRVVLTASDNKSFSTITQDDGTYKIQIPDGIYSIEFVGLSGFLTTKVENYRIAPTKMTLDIILESDFENPTTIISEMVCEPNKDNNKELNCRYVSRLGKDTGKPTNLTFQTEKKNKN